MLPTRESRILTAVSRALDHQPDSRPAFLYGQVGGDDSAYEEARSLLGYESRTRLLTQTHAVRGFLPGELIGNRFRVIRLIGRGGMGDVYEAEDTVQSGGRRVALKTIRCDLEAEPDVIDRFKQEIGLGQKITHPNVCRIYDLGTHNDSAGPAGNANPTITFFVTMELLSGCTLSELLKQRGCLPPAEALPILRQVAGALTTAHELNIVHRDLKPGNIMMVPQPRGGFRAVVTDFGLAVEITGGLASCPMEPSAGTPDYMSPEQVQGTHVGCASDIYSLGLVAYEMITGQSPFTGLTPSYRMVQRLHDAPIPPSRRKPGLEPDWSSPILRCLEREPQNRFPTANDFVRQLEPDDPALLADTRTVRIVRQRRRWPLAAAIACVLLGTGLWVDRSRISEWIKPLPDEKRTAVLRFQSIGGTETDQVLCDGLMQTVASELTQFEPLRSSLSIIPASELRKANVTSAGEAKALFGATMVVTGSVERTARDLHITVNLVDTQKTKQIRSRTFVVNADQGSVLQETVVRHVADILELELEPQAVHELSQESTMVPRAYDFYLQGVGYLTKRDSADQAIREFQQALQLDPDYALAHAGLGQAYWAKYRTTADRQWVEEASKECRRAIALRPNLPEPHIALAILDSGRGKFEEAIRHAQRAIELEPGNDQARAELARALDATGQEKAAEATLKEAVALRRNSFINYGLLATFYRAHARYGDAEKGFRRVIELVPDNPAGYTNLGGVYLEEGKFDQAEKVLKQSLQIRPTFQAASNLATLYFRENKYADAVPIMEEQVKSRPKVYLLWGNLGDAYRWAPGYADKAPAAYRRAVALTEEALRVNPKDAEVLSAQALYRAKSGDVGKALAAARKALQYAPKSPEVVFDSAIVEEIARRREAAVRDLIQAVQLGYSRSDVENDPELREVRGDPRYRAAIH